MIVDAFAGPGGWSEGLRTLGGSDIGIEHDLAACSTRAAASHLTIRADVETISLERLVGRVEGLIASPPCPDFSQAGKRVGIEGESGRLMREVPRWVEALRPRWIACEQVPPALEWYERFAHGFAELGYRTWTGLLNAANFGVPQTRTRAFLLASLDLQPGPPAPTHARNPMPSLFDAELLPWVSMAEALGWAAPGIDPDDPALTVCGNVAPRWAWGDGQGIRGRVGFPRLDDRGDSEDGYRERDWRSLDEPAFALTEKARSWRVVALNTGKDWKPGGTREDAQTVPVTEPAPTLAGAHGGAGIGRWMLDRPATTVQGDERLWPPGHKVNADDEARLGVEEARERYGERSSRDTIRLSIGDALVLQSFRRDYPVHGTKTKQFEQVGNAVPPLLAARVLEQFVR